MTYTHTDTKNKSKVNSLERVQQDGTDLKMRWRKKSKEKKRKMFFLLRLCTTSFNLIGCAASALGIGNTTMAPSEGFSELWLATVWLQNQTRAIRCSSRTLPVRPSSIPGHQRVKRGHVPSEGQKQVAVVSRGEMQEVLGARTWKKERPTRKGSSSWG